VDQHSEAATKILDALLLGDVATAETYLPDIDIADEDEDDDDDYNEDAESSIMSSDSEDSYHPSSSGRAIASTSSSSPAKKPERRGRKPGKKGSLTNIKDKGLRKKEQNKTAATRYRQKKKMEFSIILESEAELQGEHDDLLKKKDNLHREILMVKQLLRDVLQAKKPITTTSANVNVKANKLIVPGGGGQQKVSNLNGRNLRK